MEVEVGGGDWTPDRWGNMWWVTPPNMLINVIKLKWEISWTSGLPHLPGVPHLHVNRPLVRAYGRYITSVVISRILWVAAIVKTGKAMPVMSKYYRPKDLLRDLFLLLIKLRQILFHQVQPLFLSPVIHRPKKPVKPGLQYINLLCNR